MTHTQTGKIAKTQRREDAEERQARPTGLLGCGRKSALPAEIHDERAHPVSA